MIFREIADLAQSLAPDQRLMGLDLGSKTIGMAVADPGHRVASPVGTIRRKKFTIDVQALATAMTERNAGGLIIGLPLNMDGGEGPRCQATRAFARNLEGAAVVLGAEPKIVFWDERLSTQAVDRMMIEQADLSRAKRAAAIDQMAAAYILQGALDALARGR